MHPDSSTNVGITALSVLFAIALCALLAIGAFGFIFIIVNFLTRIIQTAFPKFLAPKRSAMRATDAAETQAANRKLAIDYLFSENIRRRHVEAVSQREFADFKTQIENSLRLKVTGQLAAQSPNEPNKENGSEEWDLQLLQQAAHEAKPKTNPADRELRDKAEFHLLEFPNGPASPPRYLCMKLNSASSGHGKNLRCAFAHVRSLSIRLDYLSAHRLAATMPNVFVAPANAAARLFIRSGGPKEKFYAAKA